MRRPRAEDKPRRRRMPWCAGDRRKGGETSRTTSSAIFARSEEDGAAAGKLEEDVAVAVADEWEEDGAAADDLEEDMAVAMAIRMRTGPQRASGVKPQGVERGGSRR